MKMNAYTEHIESEQSKENTQNVEEKNLLEQAEMDKKNNKVDLVVGTKEKISELLNLNFVQGHFSYILFVAFFILLYIANGHKSINVVRKINKLIKDNKDLRYEYLMYKNELTHMTQQKEVMLEMEKRGFKTLRIKPLILIDSAEVVQ